MRLINVKTLRVEEFTSQNIPKYSILSHTWGDEEISLDDISSDRSTLPRLKRLKGWKKIEYCCEQSLRDGLQYAWVDTCCINKSSSAELSEAINSMHKWYSNSEICYGYLTDVDTQGEGARYSDFRTNFQSSRWFTRGWTLQELIAPSELTFYDVNWTKLGTKLNLNVLITNITGIDYGTLAGELSLSSTSIARRMSWASNRKTTRVEDIAYCLLGIFDVHMPLLYGEGDRAFIRLQEEIIKDNDDQSIFAWEYNPSLPYIQIPYGSPGLTTLGILTPHPSYFATCGTIINSLDREHWDSHTMTNRGLKMQLPIIRQGLDQFAGVLSCAHSSEDEIWGSIVSYICIPLCPSAKGDSSLGRDPNRGLHVIRESAIENAEFLSVYLLKSTYTLPNHGLRSSIIDLPPPSNYLGFQLHEAMYASKPVSQLSTFRSFGETSYRSMKLPLIASDFIVAFRFKSSTSFGVGFTIVLESRRACDSWGVIAVPTARDEVLETVIRQNIGRLPSTYKGFITSEIRILIDLTIEKTPTDPPELKIDLGMNVQNYGLLEEVPHGKLPASSPQNMSDDVHENIHELGVGDIDFVPNNVMKSNTATTDGFVHVVEGTFELE